MHCIFNVKNFYTLYFYTLALHMIARRCAIVFLTRHCFSVYEYNCVKFYKKTSLNLKKQSPRWKFSESRNFLDSFFTRTSQRTSFGGPEFVTKYFINNSDFYGFLRLDGSASQRNKMVNVSNHFIVN